MLAWRPGPPVSLLRPRGLHSLFLTYEIQDRNRPGLQPWAREGGGRRWGSHQRGM